MLVYVATRPTELVSVLPVAKTVISLTTLECAGNL